MFDGVAIAGRSKAATDPEETVEGGPELAPSVPPEDELVGVGLDVLAAEAVEHARRPSLQVREHPMDPVQQLVRLAADDDSGLVAVVRQLLVADQPIGDDVRIWTRTSAGRASTFRGKSGCL